MKDVGLIGGEARRWIPFGNSSLDSKNIFLLNEGHSNYLVKSVIFIITVLVYSSQISE